jgi:hypothetical protein
MVLAKVRAWPKLVVRLAGAALGALGMLAAGCESSGAHRDAGGGATPVQHVSLEGIPVPSGFRLVDDRSVGVSSGPLRVAKLEFIGDLDRTAGARFYKEYMPSGGWTLREEDFDRGVYSLRFESSREQCIVRLWMEKNRTIIAIRLTPISAGHEPRDAAAQPRR